MSNALDAPPVVTRPVVFFDVSIGETPAGRIKMGELANVAIPSSPQKERTELTRLQSCSPTSHRSESVSVLNHPEPLRLRENRSSGGSCLLQDGRELPTTVYRGAPVSASRCPSQSTILTGPKDKSGTARLQEVNVPPVRRSVWTLHLGY